MSGSGKKKVNEQEHIRHFLHEMCNEEVSGSFTLKSCKKSTANRNVQERCAARAQFFFWGGGRWGVIRPTEFFFGWGGGASSLPQPLSLLYFIRVSNKY